MIIDQPVVSGSLNVSGSSNFVGNVVVTGSITATEGIFVSGSIESASFASTASNAPSYLLTSSFESYTSSINTVIKTKLDTEGVVSGSIQIQITGTTGYSTLSSSIATTTSNLSSSIGSLSSSFSSSNSAQDSRLNSLESVTGSYATTGSNVFIGTQTVSGSIIPGGVGVYNLGSETYPFQHVYLSSASLYIDGQKVIGSTAQELQITTDNGQSIKILEAGTDNITLQSADGNIELKSSGDGDVVLDPTNGKIVLKGTTEILNGNKIQSSINGTPVVFASDVIVSGGITTTGQIIAQSINVQQVTSSIVFSSGSNVFGNDLLNIQTLTGSVNITGSLKLNNSNVILTNQTGSMSVATASFALNVPVTASFANEALSSSFATNALTSSHSLQSVSSSYATTASFALNVPVTASFANEALSSSFSTNALSASFATNASTASFLLNAPATASYANESLSSSYAVTASFSLNVPVTASYANEALTSSYATTASFSLSGTGFPFSGSAEITGSLLVTDLSGSGIRYVVADEDGNLDTQTAGAIVKTTQQYTATAGQTTFVVTNGYVTGLVDVFINGTKLSADEFVDTSGTSVVITGGVPADNIVEIVKYLPAAGVSNNVLRQLTTFNVTGSQSTFNVNYTPSLLDVYYNGARLSSVDYTAENGTSITFATASVSGDTVDVMVYSYQVGAFSGIGGNGQSTELSFFNSQNSITSSQNLKFVGDNLIITGSIIATQGISAPLSGTASYSQNSNLLDGLDSVAFVQTGAFQSYTSSFSSSVATTTSNLSSSVATTTSGLSSSIGSLSGSIATTTLNLSSSLSSSIGSLSGSVATTTSGLAGRITTIEGRYATTGSNAFIGTQTITGSLYISSDLIVQGSSSLQNITASAVNIGANIVNLNTANPAIRFAGLSIFDSGSIGGSGSFLYDAVQDEFIFIHRGDNSNITSSVALMGPQTYNNVGNETYLTENYILKGTGNEHVVDSCIYEASGRVGINTNTPCSALQVNKSSQTYTGSTPSGGVIVSNLAGGNGVLELGVDSTYLSYIQSRNITNTTTYNLQLQPLGGAVGIGTISPYSNGLSVRGTSDDYSLTILQQNTNTAGYGLFAGNSGDFSIARISGGAYITPALKIQLNTNVVCFQNTICATNGAALGSITSYSYDAVRGYIGDVDGDCNMQVRSQTAFSIKTAGNNTRLTINTTGAACFACELTAKTIGTNDLILNNLNYECANYIDGTRGSWLIQEGACDLFIINQISGKKYKFNLIEIK